MKKRFTLLSTALLMGASLSVSAADVDKLTDLAFTTPSLDGLINIGPSGNSRELVRKIYEESL